MAIEVAESTGFHVRGDVADEALLVALARTLGVGRDDVVLVARRIPTERVVVDCVRRSRGFKLSVEVVVDAGRGVHLPTREALARAMARELGEDIIIEPDVEPVPPGPWLLVGRAGGQRLVNLDDDALDENCVVPVE